MLIKEQGNQNWYDFLFIPFLSKNNESLSQTYKKEKEQKEE